MAVVASQDVEFGTHQSPAALPRRGFAFVAQKLSSDPDRTTSIYIRLDEVSNYNLLIYQAEITELELQLGYDNEDAKKRDKESIICQKDWGVFVRSNVPRDREKLELAMKIREKLKRYYTAIAAHQTLLNTPLPSKNTLTALKNWFTNNTFGTTKNENQTPRLWGASEPIYSNPHDLVALRVPPDQDRLSNFIQNNFGVLFQISAPDGRTTYTSECTLARVVAVSSTLLAAVLLFGAVISLYMIKNEKALLGLLSAWTVFFAACVGLLTNVRRDQIFGATAAYAAVLVVFVSGDLGNRTSTTGSCICTPR